MNEIYILISIASIGVVLSLLAVLRLIYSTSKKLQVLHYDTNETCKLVNVETDSENPQYISIGKKRFDLAKAKPTVIKKFFGNRIFYTTHHKYKEPLQICEAKLKEVVSPDTLKDVVEMKILREFLTPKGSTNKMVYMFMIIGGVMGALTVALLFYSGLLTVV